MKYMLFSQNKEILDSFIQELLSNDSIDILHSNDNPSLYVISSSEEITSTNENIAISRILESIL